MTCKNAKRQPGYWKMDLSFDKDGYPTLAPRYIKDVTSLRPCLCKKCDGKVQAVYDERDYK